MFFQSTACGRKEEWEGRVDLELPGVTREEQHRERFQVQILPATNFT